MKKQWRIRIICNQFDNFSLETQLRKMGELATNNLFFPGPAATPLYVEDDHIPFLKRGILFCNICGIYKQT